MVEKVTSELVKDFWIYMQMKHGFIVVEKADAKEMHSIAWFLDGIGVMDHKSFIQNYTTTIGNVVYVNFEIGKGNQSQLIKQIETCVHEAQHVLQFKRNKVLFVMNYVRSDTSRCHYEVDAYRTNSEMHYFFYGKVDSVSGTISKLKNYNILEGDLHVAEKHLTISNKLIKQGVVISGISKDAISWLKKKGIKGKKVVFVK